MKRVFSAAMWFLTGWYAWAIVAPLLGLDPWLGAAIGAVVAALVMLDPAGAIWARPLPAAPAASRPGAPDGSALLLARRLAR